MLDGATASGSSSSTVSIGPGSSAPNQENTLFIQSHIFVTVLLMNLDIAGQLSIILGINHIKADAIAMGQNKRPNMRPAALRNGIILPSFNSFRNAAFNITSIMTGTGYTSSNYSAWGSFGIVIMLFIMFIGGYAGSTTGGIKIFRLQLLFRGSITQIKKLTHPHGVFLTSFNNKSVGEDAYNSIMGFFFMYIFIFILSAIVLSFF